jgi:hypothetical protein
MGTKLNPGKFDCYESAAPDEPMFVLLARDPLAPMLVELWASLRSHLASNPSKVAEARSCAEAMRQWQRPEVREEQEHGPKCYCNDCYSARVVRGEE